MLDTEKFFRVSSLASLVNMPTDGTVQCAYSCVDTVWIHDDGGGWEAGRTPVHCRLVHAF